jgi:hypothetical protein
VGFLTAVSPASATLFSLLLLRLKSTISKPYLMIAASCLYIALCIFIYFSSTAQLVDLGWNVSILYVFGEFFT